ncbi:probable inactive histone-lysine N-methyltransferase SUVR1 [Lycium ferocissimum]|uniref:probable inactive histone-lysine N-methyltransferase SUVR1 n=1 Tax=Lycium ferocissimum TaxID=112874 RepID=UPI002814A95A|nr:probable inactive histone-lysine N-methyltransferase SUVR1 [Lycium ferocissimum]XP_059300825.1 probable inactive histone-lysine N-methyltransferase SUVR1 [Lycium ferocissimum]XP_059300826.1 probable inactive histone-lysine N-methyltransferase SUVR1 [Lycium ferocissimum]XP_059300827.1 probable inactive histone-lysine N-methyltransferase SUVR1 [Lycium ferocissimum]XP_059300828.1 probable inactive histone-lysine N-methyltransferase SUVR1 [Lycium ferocissimum]XP_059300829.1 probable inactive hi
MPSKPRVAKAFRAMKDIGISQEKVKPVLKRLIKLYDKNWELIEEENYRALADAIFEKEEAEATESKKPENTEREEVSEEEVDEEPERPLKRLRLRHQEVQASSSANNSSSVSAGTNSQGRSQDPQLNIRSAAAESQSVPCLTYVRNKGKQPVSPNSADRLENNANSRQNHVKGKETQTPQIMSGEKSLVIKEPNSEPGIDLSPKQKMLGTHAFIKPKDEPYTVDLPQFEVPFAVIHPEPSYNKGSSSGNASTKQPETSETSATELRSRREADKDFPTSSNGLATSHELDIASSTSGEVKITIDCDAAFGRSDFHLPSLEAVLKLVEDKYLKPYKALDPYFSVPKLMKDMCECFLELGTQYNHELQETTNVDAENDIGYRSMALVPSNGSINLELDSGEAQPKKSQLPPPCNGHTYSAPDIDQSILEHDNSQSPVALCGSKDLELDGGEAQPEKQQLPPPCNGHNNSTSADQKESLENCGSAPEIDQNILEHDTSQSPVALCGSKDLELDGGEAQCNGHNNSTTADQTESVENCGSAPEIDQNILEHVSSQSPVALCESTQDETGTCVVTDITKGQEKVMISLVNEVNDKSPPSFHYIAHNVVFQNAYLNFSLARIGDDNSCSTCSGDCLSLSTPCACAYETGGDFAYTKEGLVKEELLKESISMNRDPKKHCQFFCKECPLERSKDEDIIEPCKGHLVRNFIKECWWKCGCDRQCGNRVVQRGISRKLQVFMTPDGKGWGLRTLEDLPRGAFICEYVGEVLTNAELFDRVSQSPNREEHSYPVLLDADWGSENVLKDEEALCLDATFFGNVARFINHRCFDSNMVEIPVEIETPDHHYYHLAFFTTRKVKALEELTWDYGIDFDDHEHPVKAFKCQCGSKFCRNMKRPRRTRARRGW